MKFRAVMQDSQFMREFQNIIVTISKLARECVLQLTGDRVHFIANEESGTTAPLVWIEIDAKRYFPKYDIKGVNQQLQQIMLSVSTLNLARAVAVLRNNARYCKLKLTHMQFPCLTIETEIIDENSERPRQVVHDVPVDVIPLSDWTAYTLPQIPNAQIVLNVSSNRLTRGLIDKIKNLAPSIVFYATSVGEMSLVAETEMATITTRYKNLELRALNPREVDREKPQVEACCSVDCRKASLFFSALQVPTLEFSCGIDHDRSIHLEVDVREGISIHSILPAVSL